MLSAARTARRTVLPLVAAVASAGLLTSACDGSPTQGPSAANATLAPSWSVAPAVVPPAMASSIAALLESWTAAWNAGDGMAYGAHYSMDADVVNPLGAVLHGRAAISATHVFLFNPANGPFRGSTSSYVVRRTVALTGTLAIVDLTVTLTGYAATPPGLVAWAPGVVKTRHHLIVARKGAGWEIIAQQMTAMQPGMPD
jgi:uncharacterized protein (TIGR02246 family)